MDLIISRLFHSVVSGEVNNSTTVWSSKALQKNIIHESLIVNAIEDKRKRKEIFKNVLEFLHESGCITCTTSDYSSSRNILHLKFASEVEVSVKKPRVDDHHVTVHDQSKLLQDAKECKSNADDGSHLIHADLNKPTPVGNTSILLFYAYCVPAMTRGTVTQLSTTSST